MSTATITLSLPTSRADGSAFAASDFASATVFRDGTQIATLNAPNLVATDTAPVPGVSVYTATVTDVQGNTSAPSAGFTCPKLPAPPPVAAPNPPAISVTIAP